jgi:hypothetical protein
MQPKFPVSRFLAADAEANMLYALIVSANQLSYLDQWTTKPDATKPQFLRGLF